MSTDQSDPPDSSERSRSLKREPGEQSKRAVCFETPRDGGERVRLALDVDPEYDDSITVSEPDGREYADAPPALPLPGSGEQYESCGEDIPLWFCEDCGSPTWVGNTCRRSRCPRCWQSWVFQRAVEAVTAISGTQRKRQYERSENIYNHHIVVSPPGGIRFDSDDPKDRLMKAGKRVLGEVDADTGYLIYHPWRIKDEYRGEVRGHATGEGDMQWKDIVNLPAEKRAEYLVHSPHLHAFVVSDNVQTETVAPDIYNETGMVIHRITKADSPKVSLYDLEDLAAATAYALSHAGLSYNRENDSYRIAARFFGEMNQIERRESVRNEVEAAMREVAGNVLGVSFRRDGCQSTVPATENSDSENRIPAGVRARSTADGDRNPTGNMTDGFPDGSEWSGGNTGGFATDSSGPEARGFTSAAELDDDRPADDLDHETETCGGDLGPMWEAPDFLNDDEWRASIIPANAERLQAAYDEWVDMGEPVPEDLPPDTEPPPA